MTKSWLPASICRNVFPYEQLAFPRRDAFFRNRNSSVENRGTDRQPCFRLALPHSMDCFRTGAKKCDSIWLLGMQRAWEPVDAKLFRDLPAGFRRRVEHR